MRGLYALVLLVGLSAASVLGAVEIARVNGKKLTDKDVWSSLSNYNEGQRRRILADKNARNQVVESLIDQELMVQQGTKLKIQNTPQFKTALSQFRRQLISNMVIERAVGSKIDDKATRKFYRNNKHRFSTSQVHAHHILLGTESEARKILKLVKQPGKNFNEIAEKRSKDPSAKRNRGDLGYFTRDKMVTEFTDPVFRAKPGAIIGPIRTAFGYHIVKIIGKKVGRPLEYDEVELKVRAALQQKLLTTYVRGLKGKAKIKRTYSNWKPSL